MISRTDLCGTMRIVRFRYDKIVRSSFSKAFFGNRGSSECSIQNDRSGRLTCNLSCHVELMHVLSESPQSNSPLYSLTRTPTCSQSIDLEDLRTMYHYPTT